MSCATVQVHGCVMFILKQCAVIVDYYKFELLSL